MGKKLIIKGANFSANAIEQTGPTPPTPSHNFIQFTKESGGSATRALYNATIPVGKSIGFADASLWSKYKAALNIGGDLYPGLSPTWDTSYSGSAYFSQNVVVTTQAQQLMIAPIDGTSLTDAMIAELNSNAFFIDD